MKKIFFAALLVIITVAVSCKKKSTEDPVTPTPDPVVSDSADITLYLYSTLDQMKYIDYCAYITLNGAEEQKLQLTETVPFDSAQNPILYKVCVFEGNYPLDSVNIYRFNFRVKKGEQSIRFYGKSKNLTDMPEYIDVIYGFEDSKRIGLSDVSLHKGVLTNTLDSFFTLVGKKTFKFTVN